MHISFADYGIIFASLHFCFRYLELKGKQSYISQAVLFSAVWVIFIIA